MRRQQERGRQIPGHRPEDPFAHLGPCNVLRRLDGLHASALRVDALRQSTGFQALLIGNPQTARSLPGYEDGLPPRIAGAVAHLVCSRHAHWPVGDHLLLVGRVLQASDADQAPLLFHRGRFQAGSLQPVFEVIP